MSITPLRPEDALSLAADKLKRATPTLWSEFEKAFEQVTGDKAEECIQAPADKVMVAQGRAQQSLKLSALFRDCTTTAAKLKEQAAKQK